jgi:SAM-dependent methyltransferase
LASILKPDAEQDDWDRHWLEYNEAAEDNPAQRFRRRAVESNLLLGRKAARVLDIGSGQGDLARLLADRYPQCEILGLEFSQTGVEISRRKVPTATFLQRDLTRDGDPPADKREWATRAICSEVLEHVDRPELLLRNAVRYCAAGCRVVVTVPGGPMSEFDRHIGHRRHYNRRSLGTLLESSGLEVDRVFTVGFPVFNLYRLVVIARGRRLMEDLSTAGSGNVSLLARLVMGVFRALLAVDVPIRRFGWQLVAVARVPGWRG